MWIIDLHCSHSIACSSTNIAQLLGLTDPRWDPKSAYLCSCGQKKKCTKVWEIMPSIADIFQYGCYWSKHWSDICQTWMNSHFSVHSTNGPILKECVLGFPPPVIGITAFELF